MQHDAALRNGIRSHREDPASMHACMAAVVRMPVLTTITHVPRALKARVGDLLTAQLLEASRAIRDDAAATSRLTALRVLWAAPTLLLRKPPVDSKAATKDDADA